MKHFFAFIIALHGALHFLGFVKAFRLADLPHLAQPISRGMGVAWLVAGAALIVTAGLFIGAPRVWWAAGIGAAVLSQVVILSSWSDAKAGTIVNVLLLCVAVYGFASEGPWSLASAYRHEVEARLAQAVSPEVVTDADLKDLPLPVQRYLRVTKSIGQPRIANVRATWRGRIRSGPDDPWMTFTAEQHNFIDEPSRFFLMDARRSGLPVDVFHAFDDRSARMDVRLLSMLPLVNIDGPDLRRAETVTLFNDLCLLAPAALVDRSVTWERIDERSARGFFTAGAHTISAVLSFNDAGELVDFVSDDRLALSADGADFTAQRWSTPVGDYRRMGGRVVMTQGEGRWHPPDGSFSYLELELLELETNNGP